MSLALREAEERWSRNQQEDRSSEAKRVEELQQETAALKIQLEQASSEQAALLKAELAAARVAWNRDKQQEISVIQASREQAYQTKLQEQRRQLEQAAQQAREDADLQRKELLLQMEAKLQQTARAREEEWKRQRAEKELTQRRQVRDEFIAELQAGLAEVQTQLLGREAENSSTSSESASGASITHIIKTSCGDVVTRALAEAKREWNKVSCSCKMIGCKDITVFAGI